eukprot:4856103-Prorocentrum_lima.AAC.1
MDDPGEPFAMWDSGVLPLPIANDTFAKGCNRGQQGKPLEATVVQLVEAEGDMACNKMTEDQIMTALVKITPKQKRSA